ncbi:hypothetical protein DJ66_0607 [Candidatus Liberibacter solanacearum]|uniref:Uncharacterized protein n=1 Tax=Candidatus Liberibacter solanacearum TaxID=556287 RepID=A0A0F4VKG7_9HYPH|nr:hypothetical protein DJ66_0607 [Candidatus Liberibacter solanacearum]
MLSPQKEMIISVPSLDRRLRRWFKYSAPTISNITSIPFPLVSFF